MNCHAVILVVAAFSAVSAQQKLPSYIKACDLTSPDFNECALKQANAAIPYIVKGDKHLGIPVLDPLRLPLVEVAQNNFKLILTDVQISGVKDIRATHFSLDRSHFDATFHLENLNVLGKYQINGKVLLLNLQGEGPANLTGVGGDYRVKAALTEHTKNGLNFLKLGKPVIEYTLKKAYFHFGNLLNGDETLGSEINQILNENWRDVLTEVGAPIKETVSTIIESIVSKILDKIPEQELLKVSQ